MMTIPDIVGAGAVVSIVLPAPARWVQFALTGSASVAARIGGPANGSYAATPTQGTPVTPGPNNGFMAPFMGQFVFYQTTEFTAYLPVGATLGVSMKE